MVTSTITGKYRAVLLKSTTRNLFLPIWIGQLEARSIVEALQGVKNARPMTHDLMLSIFEENCFQIDRLEIHSYNENIYRANLVIKTSNGQQEFDVRPSDGIALILRAEGTIFIDQELLEKEGTNRGMGAEDYEVTIEEFRDFLSSVKPEDFQT
jgi:bifunctional DNase/RNase